MSQQPDTGDFDLLLLNCRLPDGTATDLGCRDGHIAAIGNLSGRPAERTLRCEGRAVTPGLVEAHIHLDKALLSERVPSVEGTLAEAIRVVVRPSASSRSRTSGRGPGLCWTWLFGTEPPRCGAMLRWTRSSA